MSSVLINCVKKHPEGVSPYGSLEVDGKKVTLFLSSRQFFPKSGYFLIKDGEGNLEVKDVSEVQPSEASKLLKEEVSKL